LVAIKVKLGLVEMLLTKDPKKAITTLEQLKGDADEALETLRDLARGIYPPLLAEKGLPTALQAQARKATLPITIEIDGIGPLSTRHRGGTVLLHSRSPSEHSEVREGHREPSCA